VFIEGRSELYVGDLNNLVTKNRDPTRLSA
jgi:hypothetical protein